MPSPEMMMMIGMGLGKLEEMYEHIVQSEMRFDAWRTAVSPEGTPEEVLDDLHILKEGFFMEEQHAALVRLKARFSSCQEGECPPAE